MQGIFYICFMRSVHLSGLLFIFFGAFWHSGEKEKFQINGAAQGTTYHITWYANDSLVSKRQVDSILNKIDSSLSLYKPYSLVNRFNAALKESAIDRHFVNVVKKAKEIYRKTDGLFDITIFPLTDAWGFGPVRKDKVPDSTTIKELLSCVGSNLIQQKGSRLVKTKPCVQLDPNGIAQGYSVDVIADFFDKAGIGEYIIELGGEIRVKGRKPDGQKMSIGIEAPGEESDFSIIDKVIYLDKGAITTSGNYRRYYESNGKKITHLLNPKTGYYLQNEMISVTLYAKDAITADGYDNAIMAMGLKKGLAFVEKNRHLAAQFIYRKKDGSIADTMSSRFQVLLRP
jgi:thiamine biosynthesis lipoprotein